MSPALAVLAWKGGRKDLVRRLPGQFARIAQEFRSAESFTHAGMYGGLGMQLGTIMMAGGSRLSPTRRVRHVAQRNARAPVAHAALRRSA